MKYVIAILFFLFSFMFVELAAQAQMASPAAAALVPPPPAAPLGVIGFVKANLQAIALAIYALLDIGILLNPAWASNGLVHAVYNFVAKLSHQTPPAGS